MRTCFVPFCDSQIKHVGKRMLFTAPKDMFQAWKDALPKKKEFKATDKVCDRHFNPEDIITTFDHLIGGKLFRMERARPKLVATAVPHLHFPPPESYDPNAPRRTRVRKTLSPSLKQLSTRIKKRKLSPEPIKDEEAHTTIILENEVIVSAGDEEMENQKTLHIEEISASLEPLESFETFYEEIYEVMLPNTLWAVHRCPDRNFVSFSYMDATKFQTTKWIIIDSRGTAKSWAHGRLVSEKHMNEELQDAELLGNLLVELDEMRLCRNTSRLEVTHCNSTAEEHSDLCKFCETQS